MQISQRGRRMKNHPAHREAACHRSGRVNADRLRCANAAWHQIAPTCFGSRRKLQRSSACARQGSWASRQRSSGLLVLPRGYMPVRHHTCQVISPANDTLFCHQARQTARADCLGQRHRQVAAFLPTTPQYRPASGGDPLNRAVVLRCARGRVTEADLIRGVELAGAPTPGGRSSAWRWHPLHQRLVDVAAT